MSGDNPWSVQSIIERVEADRSHNPGGRRARRRPAPHRRLRRNSWRYALAALEVAFFGHSTMRLAGRHAAR